MSVVGLLLSLSGTILMLPESFRLTRKNPEGAIRWESDLPCSKLIPYLFLIGVALLAIGFIIQIVAAVND